MAERKYNTEAQKRAFAKYKEKNDLVTISVRVPREKRTQFHVAAIKSGKSLTQYLIDLIEGTSTNVGTAPDLETVVSGNPNVIGRQLALLQEEAQYEACRNIAWEMLRDGVDKTTVQKYTSLVMEDIERMEQKVK